MVHSRRALAGAICAVIVLMGPARTATAQSSPPSPTVPPVAADPTVAASTAATVPPGAGDTATTAVVDPAATTTTVDPLINESAGETVPAVDDTVPPPSGDYRGQGEYKPARVLRSNVQAAERKLADVRWMHQEMIRQARQARLEHKQLELNRQALDAQGHQATLDLEQAERTLEERAVAAFVSNDEATAAVLDTLEAANYDRVLDLQVRHRLLDVALDADENAIAEYLQLRGRLEADLVATVDALATAVTRIAELEAQAAGAGQAVAQAEAELAAFQAGSAIYISGVVFPVAQPYNRPLIDSWGFPRMPGTPDEHWHEGIDIFAPAGTALLAAERGVVTRVGENRLGGLSVWLRGESGADWYYAHLQSHAPGVVPGLVVEAGHVLGYVGNTGNAVSTPAHLHLEIHPGGGEPVNPYPLLNVIAERDAAAPPAPAPAAPAADGSR